MDGVLALPGDLVDLVHVDDPVLGQIHVIVRSLQQAQQDILHILAHIARFRQRGGVRNRKGHIYDLRQRLRQISLSGAGGTDHNDIALLQLNLVVIVLGSHHSFIVIIDGNRHHLLGFLLTDHILVKENF